MADNPNNPALKDKLKNLEKELASLQKKEAMYRSIVEESKDGIMIHDGGKVIYSNHAWAEMHGVTPEHAVGKKLQEDFALPAEDIAEDVLTKDKFTKQNPAEIIDYAIKWAPSGHRIKSIHDQQLRDNVTLPDDEALFVKDDGEIKVASISQGIIAFGDNKVVLNIVRDITSRIIAECKVKDSEKRYRTLFEHAGFAIDLLEADTQKMVAFNKTAYESLGYTKEEYQQLSTMDIHHNFDQEERNEATRRVFEEGGLTFEDIHVHKNGELRDVLISVVPVTIDNKLYLQNIKTDITDLKSAEKELKQSRDELDKKVKERTNELEKINEQLKKEIDDRMKAEQQLKEYQNSLEDLVTERTQALETAHKELLQGERLAVLGQLTATVAHEIRNPLGTISTAIFSMKDSIKKNEMDKVDRALGLTERNIKRCDNIIDELLTYTKRRQMTFEATEIDTLLDELLNEITVPKDIKLTTNLAAGRSIKIDSENFRRAIINVLNNAMQSFEGKVVPDKEVVIQTESISDKIFIKISDNGIGIPEDLKQKIFEPFFTTKGVGVGLGMSIARDILEDHGGGIEINSTEDIGTTITLWAPFLP